MCATRLKYQKSHIFSDNNPFSKKNLVYTYVSEKTYKSDEETLKKSQKTKITDNDRKTET